jgi:threonine aldolase
MAARLAQGLQRLPRVSLLHKVEANEVFVRLPLEVISGLRQAGFNFADWTDAGPDAIRLVAAFNTDPAHVAAFLSTVGRLIAAAA